MFICRCLRHSKRIWPHPGFCRPFRNISCFCDEKLLELRRTPKLEDHCLSAVRDCLRNIFAGTLLPNSRLLHEQPEITLRSGLMEVNSNYVHVQGRFLRSFQSPRYPRKSPTLVGSKCSISWFKEPGKINAVYYFHFAHITKIMESMKCCRMKLHVWATDTAGHGRLCVTN
jgi:hypothetical protein